MNIELKDKKTAYRPGEMIEGEACFTFDTPPPVLFVRLCWSTDALGYGAGDPVKVHELRIENPASGHVHHPFSFPAPGAPWSFAGAIFKVRWVVRIEDNEGSIGEAEIVIAPSGQAIAAPPSAEAAS